MKRILCMLLCILCLLTPFSAVAAPFDATAPCDLTLIYEKGGTAFAGLTVQLYRVADMTADGKFQKTTPFASLPVEVAGVTSQTEWLEIATTLNGYVQADGILPTATAVTDKNGTVRFPTLTVGLYLLRGITVEAEGNVYTFFDSMLCLPETKNGACNYTVTARPKSTVTPPAAETVTYRISKLWKDEGHREARPAAITVDILKDGAMHETVTLNEENGWSYAFTSEDTSARFAVVERDVPDGYTVTVSNKDTTFLIVNTHEGDEDPKDPPQTGETTPIHLWMLLSCGSGLLLVILGIGAGRKAYAEDR